MAKLSKAEEVEREELRALVRSAAAKRAAGEKLTRQESAAYRRWLREQETEHGLAWVAHVPKQTYAEWAGGRQTKILHDQARAYGIPLLSPTIDVPGVIHWLHDWLATHKTELGAIARGDAGPAGDESLKTQLLREQVAKERKKNEELEHKLAARLGELLPRELVHELLTACAKTLRKAGERLYRNHGQAAGDVLAGAIDDLMARVEQHLSDGPPPNLESDA